VVVCDMREKTIKNLKKCKQMKQKTVKKKTKKKTNKKVSKW